MRVTEIEGMMHPELRAHNGSAHLEGTEVVADGVEAGAIDMRFRKDAANAVSLLLALGGTGGVIVAVFMAMRPAEGWNAGGTAVWAGLAIIIGLAVRVLGASIWPVRHALMVGTNLYIGIGQAAVARSASGRSSSYGRPFGRTPT